MSLITLASSLTTTAALTGSIVNGTTNSTSTPTVLVLPQLTTPFSPPPGCTPVQSWTPATVEFSYDGSSLNATYSQVFLPVTNAEYSACQPSGWDNIQSQYRFSYSNAVCPVGYGYNQLSDLYNGQTDAETIRTTAFCCPSGFNFTMFYDKDILSLSGANCIRTTPISVLAQTTPSASVKPRNESTSATVTPGPTMATMLYRPWHITWEKKDASQLSPSPPQVSVQLPVSTWEPGTTIDPSLTRKQSNPSTLDRDLGQIIGIVVGCVGAAIIAIAATCIWLYVRSRRKRRQEFENEEHQLQEQRLQRIAEYRRPRSPTDDEPLPVYVQSREQDKATATAVAVPPYKERPSEDSSRDSRHQNEPNTRTNQNSINNDEDEQTPDQGQAQDDDVSPQNSTQHGQGTRETGKGTTP